MEQETGKKASAAIRLISDMLLHPLRYFFFFVLSCLGFLGLDRLLYPNTPLPISTSQLCGYAMSAIGEDGRTECRVSGDRVVYRWYDPQRAVWGRWRDHACDEVITYSYDSESGNITFNASTPGMYDRECLAAAYPN